MIVYSVQCSYLDQASLSLRLSESFVGNASRFEQLILGVSRGRSLPLCSAFLDVAQLCLLVFAKYTRLLALRRIGLHLWR